MVDYMCISNLPMNINLLLFIYYLFIYYYSELWPIKFK